MKLIKSAVLAACTLMLSCTAAVCSASAEEVGTVICTVTYTDIKTYVNGEQIPAYSLNGETAVRIADLANYGFDVSFENGIAGANYNESKPVTPTSREQQPGLPVLSTNITVRINGITVPGYNIDGYMAVPIERMCETYLQTNAEHIYSPYSINYIWNSNEKSLRVDISSNRVSYQDFMIDLLNAAHMGLESDFYYTYVKGRPDEESCYSLFSDTKGTKIEPYMPLICYASFVDFPMLEAGQKLNPYRAVTKGDAACLAARILGSGIEYEDYWKDYSGIRYTECENLSNDWRKIDEWLKPYAAYALLNNIIQTDDENNLEMQELLTKDETNVIISNIMNEMERGILYEPIECVFTDPNYMNASSETITNRTTKHPHLIVDNILYLSLQDLLYDANSISKTNPNTSFSYGKHIKEDGSKIYGLYSYTYSFNYGDQSILYIPGISCFYNYPNYYIPNIWELENKTRLLYGDIMVPIANILEEENQVGGKYGIKPIFCEYRFGGFENGYSKIHFFRYQVWFWGS